MQSIAGLVHRLDARDSFGVAFDDSVQVVVTSDGHVNRGISDPARLGEVARQAIARGGSGNHHFAENPDAAGAAIASEGTDLLAKSVQAASLTVHFTEEVETLRLYNDLPATQFAPGRQLPVEDDPRGRLPGGAAARGRSGDVRRADYLFTTLDTTL